MVFKIKQGHFYSKGLKLGLHFSDTLHFTAKFDESCLYIPDKEGDLNKLCGLSDFNHLKHSIRIGWRAINGQIELWSYAHVSGKKVYKYMCTINTEDSVYCSIMIRNSTYYVDIFYGDQKYSSTIERESKWNLPIRYILWPYFGGNQPAPHDMSLNLWQTYDHKNIILYIR